MAVKSAKSRFRSWNVQHFRRLAGYNTRVEELLNQAIRNAASIVARHGVEASEKPFSFSDDRQMKAEADRLMKDLARDIATLTQKGEGEEWKKAYDQAVSYISEIYKVPFQAKHLQERYAETMLSMRSRNLDALKAFQQRKIGGLKLSDKVWGYTNDLESQMEVAIDTALLSGQSADKLALSIQDLLKNPDALFRRVRDENDELRMSKAMTAYHPGPGRYRSAYKNAMRLARSEINMAYRASDSQTAQDLDCVVGVEVNLSNNHTCNGEPFTDICDELKGKYPKGFVFVGWHPQCRCFITYILKTDEEFWNDLENGENNESVNTVHDVPDGFKEWVSRNKERIASASERGTLPYFLRDNKEVVDKILQSQTKHVFTKADAQYILDHYTGSDIKGLSADELVELVYSIGFEDFDFVGFDKAVSDMITSHGLEVKKRYISLYGNTIQIRIYSSDMSFDASGYDAPSPRFEVTRTLRKTKSGSIVEHNLFAIPSPLQNTSISKDFLLQSLKLYQDSGIDAITLHANIDVGGYAWARYGFSYTQGEQGLIHLIEHQEKERGRLFDDAKQIVIDFYKSHKASDPFPMNTLTGFDWSKELLLGSGWDGALNLNDKAQLEVFINYLNSKH